MRFTLAAISLAGAASVANASMHKATPGSHALAARSVDVSVHKNDPRTLCLINGLLSGILGGSGCGPNKPSTSWKCSGSGSDGYDYDPYGKTCGQAGYPAGWKYFGVGFGWHPPRGWSVPSYSWSLPSIWIPKISICTWWSPPTQWTCPPSIQPPQWWPQHPATTTAVEHPTSTSDAEPEPTSDGPKCPADYHPDGSGNDGKDYDYDGNKCPWSIPYSNGKWKFFGAKGWQPEESWNVPHDEWQPPREWTVSKCNLATWWVPSSSWKYPSWWSTSLIPCAHWPLIGDKSWCSWLDNTPDVPAPSPTSNPAPSHPTWPSKDWTCDNSGNDGKDYDWEGKTCPYTGLPFKWFGVSKGWLPVKGWWSVGVDFQFPSLFLNNCYKATWWVPSSSWKHPVSFSIPSFWVNLGFRSWLWPTSSWSCNGSGQDGKDWDHLGNSRPSSLPVEWKYFGIGPQWQPCLGWKLPSSKWTPPASWSPKHATWWKPNTTWTLPKGYACPGWWPISLLKFLSGGILGWFGW